MIFRNPVWHSFEVILVYDRKKGTVHHEPYGSPINDEILPKQGQTRLASLACVSPCFNKISEQTTK